MIEEEAKFQVHSTVRDLAKLFFLQHKFQRKTI